MSMRVTITNDEPSFSDARIAIQINNRRIVLKGGQSRQVVVLPNKENQGTIQALRREGERA